MKTNNFKHTMLTVGVIAALGTTGTIANAAESAKVSAKNGSTITNTATATYSVDGKVQPTVTSNTVTVNINEIGSFTLIAPQGDSSIAEKDDVNEAQPIAPGGSVNFKNILKNTGNVDDTYTIDLSDAPLNKINANDDFAYKKIADTVIHVVVKDDQGNPVDSSHSAYLTELKSGDTIKLPPKYSAELSYDVTPVGTPEAGKSGLMQISATSKYITDNSTTSSDATLFNEDQGIVTKPIFKIVKTATNTPIDLNTTSKIQYKIKVTNENKSYSADATNIGIEDVIPTNLDLDTTSIKVFEADGTTPVSGAKTDASDARNLKVSKINLAKGESVVITFTVNITDKQALADAKTVTNHATVYDKFGSNDEDPFTDPDIKDSTDETTDGTTTGTTDDDDDTDVPSTVNFTNRGIELKDNNTKEIPQDGSVEVTHTLKNTGNEAEGDKAGELIITVKDTTPNDKVKPTDKITVIIYNKDGTKAGEKEIPVDSSGTTKIDIHDVLDTGIPAGGKAEIKYTETSPTDNADGKGAPVDTTDTTKVTAELKDPTATDPDASIITQENTDTFTVGTLELVKTQLADPNCDINAASASSSLFKKDSVDVKPDQCVIYRITAKNGFTTKALKAITLSDAQSNWDGKATYLNNSAKVVGVSSPATYTINQPSTSNPAVSATISEIAATKEASLLFKVKIKTDVNP